MTGLLLDTHVLLWWIQKSDRLGAQLIASIDNAPTVMFSPISVMEIELKRHRLGDLPHDYLETIRATGFTELRFDSSHARALQGIEALRDPFDRALVAQARVATLRLVTAEPLILEHASDVATPV